MREAVGGLDHVQAIIGAAASKSGRAVPAADRPSVGIETLLEHEPLQQLPDMDASDLALLLYTSGTSTGKPKGAMLSHANLLASARVGAEASELDRIEAARISISAMPMAHIFGVGVMNSGYMVPERLADGYTVQLMWFDPERFMKEIQEHRCSQMPAVPIDAGSHPQRHPALPDYDLSSLEEVICGAAPLPVELAKAFMERFSCRVREIYGMTEGTGIASANRPSDEYRPGSAGRAYPETELEIRDPDDRPVPTGELGEIVVKGLDGHARLSQPPRSDRRDDRRRLAAHRRRRPTWTKTASCSSSTARRT